MKRPTVKRRALKRIVSIVLTTVLLGLIVWFVVDNWDEFQGISLTQPWLLLMAGVFVILNSAFTGSAQQATFAPHGVRLRPDELFGIAIVTRFTNQFMPAYVAAGVRATYLKRHFRMPYAVFSSSFVVSNMIQLLTTGVGALIVFFLMGTDLDALQSLAFAGAAVAIVALLMVFVPTGKIADLLMRHEPRNRFAAKVVDRLAAMLSSYSVIRRQPKALAVTVLWNLLAVASLSLIYFCLYGAIGEMSNPLGILFVSLITSWSMVLALTPAGVGIREGMMALAAGIGGVPLAPTLVVAFLMRAVSIVASGLPSLYFGPRILSRDPRRPDPDGETESG